MKKMNKFISLLAVGIIILSGSRISACTGFTSSQGLNVLVGNNEDISMLAEPQLRIYPPSDSSYGWVVFYCKWPFPFDTGRYSAFGGMNDQGLFFDIYSTPTLEPTNPSGNPTYTGDIFAYCIRTCATVDEVVGVFNSYYIPYMDDIQGFFVDKTGNAVIIEGDDFVYKSGSYQVVTNFLQTHPELGGYPCWRYDTAISMLEDMTDFSINSFRDICEAVHMDRVYLPGFILDTIYSNVCDLNQGFMYIYFFHDFSRFVEIRLPDIFEQGYQNYDLAALFINNSTHNPNKPETVKGSISGRILKEYTYSTIGTDDDGDLLFYFYDWGDGTNSGWIGNFDSGEECSASHVWFEEGNFEIRVKTRDLYGFESEWSDPFSVSMPRNRIINRQFLIFLQNIMEKFPLLARLLQL